MPFPPFSEKQVALLARGVALYNEGRFFEAHEALEEAWMEAAGDQRTMLQGLIQVTVSFHHLRRRNFVGAGRLLEAGMKKLACFAPDFDAFDLAAFLAALQPLAEQLRGEADPSYPAPRIDLQAGTS